MKTVRTFKTARKWDPFRQVYEPCVIDELCSTYEGDMEKIVVCPQCGRKLKFGETYTSKEIHTGFGIGYAVCGDCYQKEWERKHAAEQRRSD